MAQNIPDTQTAFQKAIAIVSKAWPWLTTDKEASAMIVGIIVGVVIGWAVHRYFHKREIDGKNTEIIGLKNTVSFLEREKIGLLTTQGLFEIEFTEWGWELLYREKEGTQPHPFLSETRIPDDAILVLRIGVRITATPAQHIEDVQLEILGQRISLPLHSWESQLIDRYERFLHFDIPRSISLGSHQARLIARVAEGREKKSLPFEIYLDRKWSPRLTSSHQVT